MFTGESYDPNAQFYYLRARYYDQNVGRFLTVDPFEGCSFDPKTLHKYMYSNTNPVMFVDPSGRLSISSLMTGISIISTFLNVASAGAKALDNPIYYKKHTDCSAQEGIESVKCVTSVMSTSVLIEVVAIVGCVIACKKIKFKKIYTIIKKGQRTERDFCVQKCFALVVSSNFILFPDTLEHCREESLIFYEDCMSK